MEHTTISWALHGKPQRSSTSLVISLSPCGKWVAGCLASDQPEGAFWGRHSLRVGSRSLATPFIALFTPSRGGAAWLL